MRPLLKRNILVALICALPAILGVESATGHSGGGGSSSGVGSSGGHGGGNFPSGHSSTGINSAHMSGTSLGGRFATNPGTQFTGTGDAASGRFVHKGAIQTSPDQRDKQRQFDTGYVPSKWQGNDQWWRKRHRYHHVS
jgi:hypothetical protein